MARRAIIRQINENVTLIDDAGDSTCYLVTGEKQALLIDTLNGRENLYKIVRELTSLPVTVVNTHGHGDHVWGNIYFEEAYLHPADWAMYRQAFSNPMAAEILKEQGRKPCRLMPFLEDAVFDLGGITLEVIPVKGHTAGSVTLLCRKHKILFSGDAVIGHLWMQLDHSLPFSELETSLERLLSGYDGAFDKVLTGHSKGLEDAVLVKEIYQGVQSLLRGEHENDKPCAWFGRTDMAHPVNADGSHMIVYNKTSLDIQRGIRPPYPPIRHISNNPTLAGMAYIRPGIVYSTATGEDLTLALITPWRPEGDTARWPLMVFVQGSAWTSPDIYYEMGQMAFYAQHGIAVAMVTHRNCLDGHPFPAFLQDVKTAIRHLRAHSEEYHIEKNRVGIWGTSSGGNTALLAGLTGDDPAYKTEEYKEESDAVCTVVECFGPTALPAMVGDAIPEGPHKDIFRALVGGQNVKDVYRDMSPAYRVHEGKTYPPFLLIHGDDDTLVPYDQMTMMYRALWDHGADVQAICVDGAPHEGSFWSRELHEIILAHLKEKL